jgi:hypothetical protein
VDAVLLGGAALLIIKTILSVSPDQALPEERNCGTSVTARSNFCQTSLLVDLLAGLERRL